MSIDHRSDVWFENPIVTIQQRANAVTVHIREESSGITEVKLTADTLSEVLDAFLDKFEGSDKSAINFNFGEVSVWMDTDVADAITHELQLSVDIGIRQVINV